MLNSIPTRRAGMTLVELLVVVAIIGLLAVTVLPNVASTTDNRRSREAARVTSSFFAKAQSRAIGRPEWAGVTLLPPPTNPTALFAIDLFQANVPQVYRGESYASTATLTLPASSKPQDQPKRAIYFSDAPSRDWRFSAARSVTDGDLIRFNGRGPWYELTSLVEDTTRDANSPAVMLRGVATDSSGNAILVSSQSVGHSTTNTPWPTLDVGHQFEILRKPVRNGSAFTIPDGRCIDLAWSGFGAAAVFGSNRFTTPGTAVTLLFDATGRVRQIFTQSPGATPIRVTVTGPVFFLVGRVDRAGNSAAALNQTEDSVGANWQYGDSYWIVIDPASGIVKTAECSKREDLNGDGKIDPGEDVNLNGRLDDIASTPDVLVSQAFARSHTPVGGN
jgi:prepilin-type N-terminal cleavage/methylation domain-containing protein